MERGGSGQIAAGKPGRVDGENGEHRGSTKCADASPRRPRISRTGKRTRPVATTAGRSVARRKQGERAGASWKQRFLTALMEHGNVGLACMRAGIHRQTAYQARALHPEFARAWAEAKAHAVDRLEAEAYRRAVIGVERKKLLGKRIITVREYSDQLLMFLLKGERPEKFRDQYPEAALTEQEVNEWTREQCEAYRAGMTVEMVRVMDKWQRGEAQSNASVPQAGQPPSVGPNPPAGENPDPSGGNNRGDESPE
jgi:hypothetical protein